MPGKWASRVTVCSHHCHKVEEVAGGGEVVEADSIKKVSDIKLLHVLAGGGKGGAAPGETHSSHTAGEYHSQGLNLQFPRSPPDSYKYKIKAVATPIL